MRSGFCAMIACLFDAAPSELQDKPAEGAFLLVLPTFPMGCRRRSSGASESLYAATEP